jgi:two-component system KDP operon response regulator KdpE
LHHVLLLDSSLDASGSYAMCRAIRPKSDVGIILLNRDETGQGRIDALNAGADDCVPERCTLPELLARVRALLRRVTLRNEEGQQIFLHDRAIDLKSHKIKGPIGRVENLTPKEFLVLQCLVAQPNKPLAHRNLAQAVWQRDGQGEVEYVRVVIKQLRKKLELDPARPRYILTEHSVGYRFQLEASAEAHS